MKKPVLAVDFDDVLFDCNTALCLFHNARYGTSLVRDDITTYWLKDIWKCSLEEALQRIGKFVSSSEHHATLPVPGAPEALQALRDRYEIHIVTSRANEARTPTEDWLQKHFEGLYEHLHFTNHFSRSDKISKSDICKKISADYLIEDALVHAEDVAQTNTKVLLLDAPWNQEQPSPNIIRVYSWKEILDHLH